MYYDMNVSQKFNEVEVLENSEYRGFCINKKIKQNAISQFNGYGNIFKLINKKCFRKLTIILNNYNVNIKSLTSKCDVLCLHVPNFDMALDDNVCDIVTCDFTKQIKFKNINPNLFYEVDLVSALYDKHQRMVWMWNVRELIRLTKCKNIIFGTGASTCTELKSPLDIMKMLAIFDLSEDKMQQIMSNGAKCLEKCARKRFMSNNCVFNDIPEGDLKEEFLINKSK